MICRNNLRGSLQSCFMFFWYPPQEFVCDARVCDKCAPYIPVTRLIVRSGFGDDVGCIKAAARNDTQEITSLDSCLIWKNATVCDGRVWLNISVRV